MVLQRGDLDESRVHPGQVVVLHEVLRDELPVCGDRVVDPAQEALLLEPVAGEAPGKIAELLFERRRVGVEAAEDDTAPRRDARGVEAEVALVELAHAGEVERALLVVRDAGLRREERCAEARAVQAVRPRVVRALEEAVDVPARLGDKARAAVPADVVVGAQVSFLVAADDQRPSGNLGHDKVAGLGRPRR